MSPWKLRPVRRFVGSRAMTWLRCGLLYGERDVLAFVVGVFGVMWGAYLAMPWVTLFIPGRPTLGAMAGLAEETTWIGGAIGIGIALLISLYRGRQKIVSATTLAAFLFWTFITYLHLLNSPYSPHTAMYMAVALLAAAAHLRAALLHTKPDGGQGCE